MRRVFRIGRIAMIGLLLLAAVHGPAAAQEVTAHVFWQEGCPYCERAREALAEIAAGDPQLDLNEIELGPVEADTALFGAVVAAFEITRPAVPLVVIGERPVLGYGGQETRARYVALIEACRAEPCRDVVAEIRAGRTVPTGAAAPEPPATVDLPWLGEVSLARMSLPVLTVVLAGIDGFNPCAMWVLALLIGLLLGVEDSRRMWVLGLVFLVATGAMYFAIMAAWLNVVMWIGAVTWLRLAIGALAVGAGLYYLHDYRTNPEGLCRVTPSGRRKSVADAFRAMVERPNLLLASLGVAALAIAVNLVELVCSAGVPAIYAQILAMHDLAPGAYYGYLGLYLAVFLLDDAAIFVVAMLTLRAVAATGRYARLSHLVGGLVLLGLGALMLLRPDLLA